MARRGVETSQTLRRHGWVTLRTFAWINRYRRLVTRCERRSDIRHALTALPCSLICFNELQGGFERRSSWTLEAEAIRLWDSPSSLPTSRTVEPLNDLLGF